MVKVVGVEPPQTRDANMRRSNLSGRQWLLPIVMIAALGAAACTAPAGATSAPAASPSPSGMMEASPSPSGMMEASPSPSTP
jgi:hypothetical protein